MTTTYFDHMCEDCGNGGEASLYGWCKVCQATSLVLFAEWALRWGLQLAVLIWALRVEWSRYQRTQPLVELVREALPGRTGFRPSVTIRMFTWLVEVFGIALMMCPLFGQSTSLIEKWVFAWTACVLLSFVPIFESSDIPPTRLGVDFKGLDGAWYFIACRSADGPFYFNRLFPSEHEADKVFATLRDLAVSLKNSKAI
jgi:hypothetical protein